MTKTRSTKRALLMSALSLLLCVSMLVGSTFAWFTDSVTSAGNIIKSGNLDVTMEWYDGTKEVPAADSAEWIDAANGAIFDYDLWEPGYTAVRHIKIANEGSLALKYQLNIVANGEVSKLAEAIDVYYVDPAVKVADRAQLTDANKLGTLAEVLEQINTSASGNLEAGDKHTITLALKMRESAGNEYQNLAIGSDFSVQLLATQYTSESDSFGDDYDTDAEFPSVLKPGQVSAPVTVLNGAVAEAVKLQGDGISASVPAGVALEDGTQNLALSITPMGYTTSDIDVSQEEVLIPVDVHIEGVAEDNTVPIVIELGEILPKYLNMGNYSLIHVEDGTNQTMTFVDSVDKLTAHNTYTYDSTTGAVTVAMANFSEVALFANTANVWQGNTAEAFAGGDGTAENPYRIANADQLALLNEKVSNENETYGSAHYRVIANIDLGSGENGIFYPIGYHKFGDDSETWYTYGGAFSGTFDGNGHIISGIKQRTWDMKGDYDNGYWNEAMGLFGYVNGGTVKNLVINNFFSEGEFAPTGCITAYAAGDATFENIAIINSHPQTYNTGVAGIIGWDDGGDTEAEASNFTFNNITVDDTTTVSALWGSWDVAAAGILGYLGEYSTATFNDCHVSATIDVYNDVCGNYQYYWYRYCGAYIGTVDRRQDNGKGALDLANVTANNCTVAFGDRHEYYYCEFEKNSQASYTEDYQFSRIDHADLKFTDTNGNGLVDVDEKDSVTGCTHTHTANEDKQAVYIPFRQLFGGYGWGVDGVDVEEYKNIEISTVTTAVEKFTAVGGNSYYESDPIQLSELFQALEGAEIRGNNVQVTVSPADESSTVTGTYRPNIEDWTQGTLILNGLGNAIITITDYAYCLPTTIQVTVKPLFVNGDFEGTNLTHWKTAANTSGLISLKYAQVTSLDDGNKVLEILPAICGKGNGYVINMNLEAGTAYRLTFKAKGAKLGVTLYDGSKGTYLVGSSVFTTLDESADWKEYIYTFTTESNAPAGIKTYLLQIGRNSTALKTITDPTYLDDFKLVKVN